MSFSRNHRFHQGSSAANRHHGCGVGGLNTNDGQRWRWASLNNVYYESGGMEADGAVLPPPSKRRRPSSSSTSFAWHQGGTSQNWPSVGASSRRGDSGRFGGDDRDPSTSHNLACHPKLAASKVEHDMNYAVPGGKKKDEPAKLAKDEDPAFMSRDEIERSSPSRKDGIDLLHETHLRYSYCAFLQNLGIRLELPQTTIGTAMVLCHRFFLRRSHAYHDRFLIATAALFLAAKSEETPCLLNNVLKASGDICFKLSMSSHLHSLPFNWFESYRERVIDAENLILTTLDFELDVQHPYTHLAPVLDKLGLTQSVLVNVAWNLINEGLRSSLWLQFKPHHIAAGAAFLAAQLLNLNLGSCHSIWQEFQTSPSIIQDVVQQLLELL